MTGPVSQSIALTSYGNDFLRNGNLPVAFYPGNSTFQFCNTVDFREAGRRLFLLRAKEIVVASDPQEWFKYLKDAGCQNLRLHFQYSGSQESTQDYQTSGFVGGGGTWFIEAIYPDHSNYWTNRWAVNRRDDPNRQIWAVNYWLYDLAKIANEAFDLSDIRRQLDETLKATADFAFKMNFESWGKTFDDARSVLKDANPGNTFYHKDLIPQMNYQLPARQILFAAGAAWVFGGMGSWNDLWLEDDETRKIYNNLTKRLYSIVVNSIIAAINSY